MTINIPLTPELERKLRASAAAAGVPAEAFVVSALADRLDQESEGTSETSLTPVETRLLQEINQGLPEPVWRRYRELVALRREERLSPTEHQELKELTNRIESAHARRLQHVAELARLRQMRVEDLLDQLGIHDPGYD